MTSVSLQCTECKTTLATNQNPHRRSTWEFLICMAQDGTRHVCLQPSQAIDMKTEPVLDSKSMKNALLFCQCGHNIGSHLKKSVLVKDARWVYCVDGERTTIQYSNQTSTTTREWKQNDEQCALFALFPKYCSEKESNGVCSKKRCQYLHCEKVSPQKKSGSHREKESRPVVPRHQGHASQTVGSSSHHAHSTRTNEAAPIPKGHAQPSSRGQMNGFKKPNTFVKNNRIINLEVLLSDGYVNNPKNKDLAEILASDEFSEQVLNKKSFSTLPIKQVRRLIQLYISDAFLSTVQVSLLPKALQILLNSRFWAKDMNLFIQMNLNEIEDVFSVVKLFESCLRHVRQDCCLLSVAELKSTFERKFLNDANIELVAKLSQRIQSIESTRNVTNIRGFDSQLDFDEEYEAQNQNWAHNVTILPSIEELKNRNPNLRSNKHTFQSAQEYLSTHFNLLKEEFVEPLRAGLKDFLHGDKLSSRDLSIFPNVEIESVEYKNSSVNFVVRLDKSKKLKDTAAFLQYGNLVCLYPMDLMNQRDVLTDEHYRPIFAIISDRRNIEAYSISLSSMSSKELSEMIDALNRKYLLIESPVYFTSVRSVLQSLSEMSDEDFINYEGILLRGERTSQLPRYIQQNPLMDISNICKDPQTSKHINVSTNWINDDSTILDPSQSKAVQHALTNSLAIIQGPPGCGKTFIGRHIIKIIHKHLERGSGPIVCVCYTNHALDQLLEGLIGDIPNLVRIGGRSRTENGQLAARNLSALRIQGYANEIRLLDKTIHSSISYIQILVALLKLPPATLISQLFPQFAMRLLSYRDGDRIIPIATDNTSAVNIWLNGKEKEQIKKMKRNKKGKNQEIETSNQFKALAEDHSGDNFAREITEDKQEEHVEKEDELADEDGDWQIENRNNVRAGPQGEGVNEDNSNDGYMDQQHYELLEIEAEYRALEQQMLYGYDDEEEYGFEQKNDVHLSLFNGQSIYLKTYAEKIQDLYKVSPSNRKNVIDKIMLEIRDIILTNARPELERVTDCLARKEDLKAQQTLNILRGVPLIGLTSTCAAMNRAILRKLGAPVYVFEEAAELLECQITAIMNKNIQHIIMIGDEKQLQPKVNSYFLQQKMKFSISMFERLVNNHYEHETLKIQQRMRPEVSSIARLFYPFLIDHPSVQNRQRIAGVDTDVCFLTHSELEDKETLGRSKTNLFEAELSAKLAVYLLRQPEHQEKDITIITPYKGQMFLIRGLLQKRQSKVRVVTIDDFQGEENKIIILSLVRSNNKEKIGFVGIQNRIIVALSRARDGLYIIGNGELLSEKNDDWDKVVNRMEKQKFISDHLPLCCSNHPDTISQVRCPSDLDKVIHGGCTRPCTYQFDCGHLCISLCHPGDHSKLRCEKTCKKPLPCGHDCLQRCHHMQDCGLCTQRISYTIPRCGHSISMKCSDDKNVARCDKMCGKKMICGHICQTKCSECRGCGKCNVFVKSPCTTCNRTYEHKCGAEKICTNPCNHIKECGHPCGGRCSIDCKHDFPCEFKCNRSLLCGHRCKGKHLCSQPCPDCIAHCCRRCSHTTCRKKCGDACILCQENCTNRCIHRKCSRSCSDLCDVPPCNERCSMKKKCGHQCNGLCGELCPTTCIECDSNKPENEQWQCSIMLLKSCDMEKDDLLYRLSCGHEFSLDGIDGHMRTESTNENRTAIKHKTCPNCSKNIVQSNRYQDVIKENLARVEQVKGVVIKARKEQERRVMTDVIRIVTRNEVNNQGGHWFLCPNGHPYMIADCGGAMVESKCPDCGEQVGGSQHTLLATNSLATNIENNDQPAWPTMLNR